jgi:hypothetical protein
MMADRPINFRAYQVQAALAGRLSQTRRVLKPQPQRIADWSCNGRDGWRFKGMTVADGLQVLPGDIQHCGAPFAIGDRLWVREAWRTHVAYDDLSPAQMGGEEPLQYEADGAHQTWGYPAISKIGRYRHARFMPRWASRLTLVVTDVRVQRVQDISASDSLAEGVSCETCDAMGKSACGGAGCFASLASFRDIWNRIHGPDAWERNDWVAAVTFTVHKNNVSDNQT